MSSIASFYVFPAATLEHLIFAARTGDQYFKDDVWEYLHSEAVEQAELAYSGSIFCALVILLEDRIEDGLFGVFLASDAVRLGAEYFDSAWLFDFETATSLRQRIQSLKITTDEVRAHVSEEYGDSELDVAVFEGLQHYLVWLAGIGSQEFGLLTVG